jgi:hypothetical protein
MSGEDSKRALHRQRQVRYEARMRDGIGLFSTLRASEIAGPMVPYRFSTNHSKNEKRDGRRTADCLTGFRWQYDSYERRRLPSWKPTSGIVTILSGFRPGEGGQRRAVVELDHEPNSQRD